MGVDEALKMVISGGVVVPPKPCEQSKQLEELSKDLEHKKP
jgi:uncharacterized membrane protein